MTRRPALVVRAGGFEDSGEDGGEDNGSHDCATTSTAGRMAVRFW